MSQQHTCYFQSNVQLVRKSLHCGVLGYDPVLRLRLCETACASPTCSKHFHRDLEQRSLRQCYDLPQQHSSFQSFCLTQSIVLPRDILIQSTQLELEPQIFSLHMDPEIAGSQGETWTLSHSNARDLMFP